MPDIDLQSAPSPRQRTIEIIIPEAPPEVKMPVAVVAAPATSAENQAILKALVGTWTRTSDGGPDLVEGGYTNSSWTFDISGRAVCRRSFSSLDITKGFSFVVKSPTVIHVDYLPGSGHSGTDLAGFRGITAPIHTPPCDLQMRIDGNTLVLSGVSFSKVTR